MPDPMPSNLEQKLAKQEVEVNSKPELKKNTQTFKIQEIWKRLNKSEWMKEKDEDKKSILKGGLYTEIQEIYKLKTGRDVKRSTIRRCVNSFIKQAK